jgi:hypothetical protein
LYGIDVILGILQNIFLNKIRFLEKIKISSK